MLAKMTVAIVVGAFMALLSSCAVTTRSTQGTSETFANTTDASSDFTSSTSPRSGPNSETQKAKVFASVNLERLQEDMARGGGEHLTAFAHLLGVSERQQPQFFALTKQNYATIFSSEPTTSEQMLTRLNAKLDEHPTLRTMRQ